MAGRQESPATDFRKFDRWKHKVRREKPNGKDDWRRKRMIPVTVEQYREE
jgi:hypothetical protein